MLQNSFRDRHDALAVVETKPHEKTSRPMEASGLEMLWEGRTADARRRAVDVQPMRGEGL
jgi:hypothetical protein